MTNRLHALNIKQDRIEFNVSHVESGKTVRSFTLWVTVYIASCLHSGSSGIGSYLLMTVPLIEACTISI